MRVGGRLCACDVVYGAEEFILVVNDEGKLYKHKSITKMLFL